MTKPTKICSSLQPRLLRIGYYISPAGGSPRPYRIGPGHLLVEAITRGRVDDPGGHGVHGPGTLFLHREGQETVSRCGPGEHYECMVANFKIAGDGRDWPRSVGWPEIDTGIAFAREMVYSHHHTGMTLDILGPLIWSRIRFLMEFARRKPAGEAMSPPLAACLSHIERDYARPLRLDMLAERVGWSVSHLHSQFRRMTGTTPHRHLIRQRMREARHRLVTTRDPVKAIAFDVGYANTENFCRAFKKETGVTAAEFRKRYMMIRSWKNLRDKRL